jgi:hypothetical protein
MNDMALLNGEFVDDNIINPKYHKYIGSFREPQPPIFKSNTPHAIILCNCGAHLHYVESIRDHWQKGCFDVPQYVMIKNKEKKNYEKSNN